MTAQQSPQPGAMPRRSNRAIRLTFTYEGDQVRLVNRLDLEKIVPPSDPVGEREKRDQSGFWIEVQDVEGRTLYRLVRANPIETSVEIHTGVPGEMPTRQPVVDPRGTFSLLVPALPGGQDVVLYSSPVAPDDPKAFAQPASELARFDLSRPVEPDQSGEPKEEQS